MTNSVLNQCLCCGSGRLHIVLDLHTQPPANLYLREPNTNLPKFPLCLNRCGECWHAQLSWNVNRNDIFDEYAYVSGTSKTLQNYFAWFSAALQETINHGARVLEIAANDGSLIQAMQEKGFICTGVDPAKNIVASANRNGLPLQLGYWPEASAQIAGLFDVIIGMNVLAHVDAPLEFLLGCKQKLTAAGVVIIQPSQARMFENGEFDSVYHEHISFFNSRSIAKLATRAGLRLVDTALVKIHGDSPVYFLQHIENSDAAPTFSAFRTGDFAINENLIEYEQRVRLFDERTYQKFAEVAYEVIDNLKEVVTEHKAMGFKIAFVGAAAKAITLLNASEIQPDHLLDEAPLKVGMYAPGCNIIVEPLTAVTKWTKPTLFILSAWNFRIELSEKLVMLGVPPGSKFYSYFPHPQWIEHSQD